MSVRDPGFEANLALLRLTVARLCDLNDELVFVGGSATGLLITATRAQVIRVTTDRERTFPGTERHTERESPVGARYQLTARLGPQPF